MGYVVALLYDIGYDMSFAELANDAEAVTQIRLPRSTVEALDGDIRMTSP